MTPQQAPITYVVQRVEEGLRHIIHSGSSKKTNMMPQQVPMMYVVQKTGDELR